MFQTIILQNVTAVSLLVVFFVGRFTWSKVKGKRQRSVVSFGVISGRLLIQVLVGGLIPFILILNIFSLRNLLMISQTYYFVLYIAGLCISILGLLLMFLARFHRQKDWGFMGDSTGEQLFTKGVYRITRHPYYIGAILVGLGVYLILNSWVILLMIPVIMFVKKVIDAEDKYLFQKFGNEWVKYKSEVRIIPFVKF